MLNSLLAIPMSFEFPCSMKELHGKPAEPIIGITPVVVDAIGTWLVTSEAADT